MDSKKLSAIFLFFSSVVFAQQDKIQYIHKHLVRADASIVGGYLFNEGLSNVHINGSAEYYMDNKISIRGSASYLLGSSGITNDSMGLKDFHSIYLGAAYHFTTNGHFDPYVIVQPGVAYTSSFQVHNWVPVQLQDEQISHTYYPGVVSPLATVGVGFNYYFQRFAHLFVETRYVYGRHLSQAPSPISLEELRITFGLGFNLFVVKEKKKNTSS
ncbi:MAG: hypothetical protein IPP64_02770 [Bacteroidetes bacterium]|nr:hypothetical protein [Bacteroidota bacterium]